MDIGEQLKQYPHFVQYQRFVWDGIISTRSEPLVGDGSKPGITLPQIKQMCIAECNSPDYIKCILSLPDLPNWCCNTIQCGVDARNIAQT